MNDDFDIDKISDNIREIEEHILNSNKGIDYIYYSIVTVAGIFLSPFYLKTSEDQKDELFVDLKKRLDSIEEILLKNKTYIN